MGIVEVLLISVGLSADAFAVALGAGASGHGDKARPAFRISFHFGLFQCMMPIIGWLVGMRIEKYVREFDHWIAFGLLAFIGGHMIYESFQRDPDEIPTDPTKGMRLAALSVATSLDALAVGMTLAMLKVTIWYPSVVFGVVTAGLSLCGVRLGSRLRGSLGHRVEQFGGLLLIGIGIKILFTC